MNIMYRCMMITAVVAPVVIPAYSQSRTPGGITVAPPIIRTSADGIFPPSFSGAPSGVLYFSTPDRRISGRMSHLSFSIGLRYDRRDIGVQGIELTVELPEVVAAVDDIRFGPAMESPENWTLDYSVRRTRGGSTLKIIAFGRDTAAGIGAGLYDDLLRISCSVSARAGVAGEPKRDGAEITITDVSSALAHSLGYSAGIATAPERSVLRLTLAGPVAGTGGDLPAGHHLPAGIADALRRERTPGVWRLLPADTVPETDGATAEGAVPLLPHEAGGRRARGNRERDDRDGAGTNDRRDPPVLE